MQAAGTTIKEEFILKFDLKKDLKRLLVVCLASVLMALNIKSFVRTGGLYPGGATGLSLLIQRGAQMYLGLALPYTVINVILNAIPIYIGFRFIGKKFTLSHPNINPAATRMTAFNPRMILKASIPFFSDR